MPVSSVRIFNVSYLYYFLVFQVSVFVFPVRIRAPSRSHGRCNYSEISNMPAKLL